MRRLATLPFSTRLQHTHTQKRLAMGAFFYAGAVKSTTRRPRWRGGECEGGATRALRAEGKREGAKGRAPPPAPPSPIVRALSHTRPLSPPTFKQSWSRRASCGASPGRS